MIKESTIENKLSQIFKTYVNAEIDESKETDKFLVFTVKIDKPQNYKLYNWLKSKIGEQFVLENNELIIFDRLEINTINEVVNKIKELTDELAWGFKITGYNSNFDSENEENGIILSWEEDLPF